MFNKSLKVTAGHMRKASMLINLQARLKSQHLKAFATLDPGSLSLRDKGMNLVKGEWVGTKEYIDLIDPLTGRPMIKIPDTKGDEINPFIESL